MEVLAPVFAILVFVGGVVSILRTYFLNRRLAERARLQAQIQSKLIERLEGSEQVASYLESEIGKRAFVAEDDAGLVRGYGRVLDSIQTGVVTLLAGAGLMTAGEVGGDPEMAQVLGALGRIALLVGVGFLISSALSWWVSKRMGLLPERPRQEGADAR